jgi:hypothetical protein
MSSEPTISADQLDFCDGASTLVVSDTLRFVLPVPRFEGGGEPLVYPHGEHAGKPFVDRNGKVITGRGIVYFDPDDESWEVGRTNGCDVILMSPINREQGAKLVAKVKTFAANPADLTLDQVKAILRYALETVRVRSTHASTTAFVAEALVPVEPADFPGFGLHSRRADDPCRAVFVAGSGRFLGPAASPQRFRGGAVIVRHGDDVRLVQRRSFERTYRFPDGRPARISELAVQAPRAKRG